ISDDGFYTPQERIERAEGEISWTDLPAPKSRAKRVAPAVRRRVAKLHDEEARLEEEERAGGRVAVAASGPVGALLILLAIRRHGLPSRLRGRNGGELTAFPDGAIEATWEDGSGKAKPLELPIEDLFALVRYAL
ncbi:MAG: hypothetical protein L3K07_05220, partial [Thermoplasmata archaeon]|nr:hypothetical protein [Thermoplasmata archaeon]